MPRLEATAAHYIKLGEGGKWEEEALHDGVLRFSYRTVPHDACVAGNWDVVRAALMAEPGADPGAVQRHLIQVQTFYTAPETDIFITFHHRRMYWCRPEGAVELLADGTKRRGTVDGWRGDSVGGQPLIPERLSGQLQAVQMFRGTICTVAAKEYLLKKLGDEVLAQVQVAERAEEALLRAQIDLITLLTWQDFETLVELVFSGSGWRRTSTTGGAQKTVDLELVLPSTGDRAFVQVKSRATAKTFQDYVDRLAGMPDISRMFFVWHTGGIGAEPIPATVTPIGPERLAQMVLDAGLTKWLREKVS
ncbi:restriction endonuclease [Rubellimicrobium roseum]|uniref:Restriction endonuclease type IV Mrr domain-containing protein n=1 Tax=Rubellimicrobium roseum TaxID=687525 RepID=A0A5C4NBC7_9RHOB|nr:restriction endonuclease [Rubellimicrobium roseum]TNC72041.1 hypothetical protein FHG71_09940 [Rubellimicrobium roseum]